MDLESHLLALLGRPQLGDEVVPGAVLRRVSSELGWRITLSVDGTEMHVDIERARDGRRFAARTQQLFLSYRQAGRDGSASTRGRTVCQQLAQLIELREGEVLDAVAHESELARSDESGARIREVRVARALEIAGSDRERFYALSPYVGCLIGCRFCYAQSAVANVRRLEMIDDSVPWGSYVDVRANIAAVLADELARLPVHPIKFCPIVSDPYQAVESRHRVTRACLEAIRDASRPWPVAVLTRSTLVARDADLIASIPQSYAGASIPTADDEVRRHFEPRGATVDERFALLRDLRARGVRTFAIVQPLLPGSIEQLADRLAEHVASVRIDVLHGVESATREFSDPRYAESADPEWQLARATELAARLTERGVAIWPDELPPDLVPA